MLDWLSRFFYQLMKGIADAINAVIGFFDIDPIPGLVGQVDLSGNAVAIGFGWLNDFFPITFFVSSTLAFLAIMAVAWLVMTLWAWLKAGGEG